MLAVLDKSSAIAYLISIHGHPSNKPCLRCCGERGSISVSPKFVKLTAEELTAVGQTVGNGGQEDVVVTEKEGMIVSVTGWDKVDGKMVDCVVRGSDLLEV